MMREKASAGAGFSSRFQAGLIAGSGQRPTLGIDGEEHDGRPRWSGSIDLG